MEIQDRKEENTAAPWPVMPDGRPDLRSMNIEQLERYMESLGQKKFRASQLYEWMHRHLAASLEEMTNLPQSLRKQLSEEAALTTLRIVEERISKIDGTRKYLFALPDGNVIESVLMRYKYGNSVCISSQVGCAMGCRFCASTIGGKIRNLSAGEMLEQVYRISAHIGERISHVVVMGTGEPLDNYDALLAFIKMLTDQRGLNLSQRNITVSTCGLAPKIRLLAREHLEITLALSLHASTQQKRQQLMPVANRYDLAQVLDACRYYFECTGRRISFEYALVRGVNDTQQDVDCLKDLLGGMTCHINLIPVNPVKERSFQAPERQAVLAFQNKLEKCGINVTIRREMGRDINGACGQLRRSYLDSAGA